MYLLVTYFFSACVKSERNSGKNTFLFSGAKIFNKLPVNIVNADNIQTFCRLAKHDHNFLVTYLLAYYCNY